MAGRIGWFALGVCCAVAIGALSRGVLLDARIEFQSSKDALTNTISNRALATCRYVTLSGIVERKAWEPEEPCPLFGLL